jgi:hypothetical protein
VKRFLPTKLLLFFVTLGVLAALSQSANAAASIVILNNDGANTGFNDPTAVAPVGNNSGTTLGQQRLNAFQFAANIWGATLNSNVTITIRASWASLTCTTTTAVLGQAGAAGIFKDFPNAPVAGTWYAAALANALSGVDLDPNAPEITAQFNSNLGNPGCLDGRHFYLGLDNNHGSDVELVTVLIHEFGHGLGFQTFTSSSSGALNGGSPSIYDRFLLDSSTGKTWDQMTNAERQASATNTRNLVWNGAQTRTDVGIALGTPRFRVNSPAGIAGNYTVGTADFGSRLLSTGLSANVAQASPADGCSTITNTGAMSGRVALVDRGNCNFIVKVKNAQNAGAIGVIVVNNDTASPTAVIAMGGGDPTITIPTVMISLNDGSTVKGQLGGGVNATLLLDTSTPQGADGQGRALMFTPNPLQTGSSVSHWDSSMSPNQLMEPASSGDLTYSVTTPQDLTASLLRDIGWSTNGTTPTPTPTPTPAPTPTPNPIDSADFFVKQHYLDFLNRTPDAGGLAFWTNEITSCGNNQACIDNKRVNVSAAFFISIEFQQTGYLVERLYKTAFGDGTGTSTFNTNHQMSVPIIRFSEFLPDTQQIGQGVVIGQPGADQLLENNKVAFINQFVARTRFTNKYPVVAPAADPLFVKTLNDNAGNPLSTTEVATLSGEYAAGTKSRAIVLRQIAEHQNLVNSEYNRAFVLMQFFGYLRRNPNDPQDIDYTGYDFWLTKLISFTQPGDDVLARVQKADMVKAFIVSGEYRKRFGTP